MIGGICFVLGITKHLDVLQIMNFSSVHLFIYFGKDAHDLELHIHLKVTLSWPSCLSLP